MKNFLFSWKGIVILAVLIVGGVSLFFVLHKSTSYKLITVTQGSITETVPATGNTTPIKSVSLGFQNSGTIAHVYYNLGDQVQAGTLIAELSTGNLYASLEQAKANLAVAQANLASVTAGTRPEQITIYKNTVLQDESALINAITSAYSVSDSAVHTSSDQLFTNPRTASAALTFTVPDATIANLVIQERVALEPILSAWNSQISSPTFNSTDPLLAATQAAQNLGQVSTFLNNISAALTKTQSSSSFSAATLNAYEASIDGARSGVVGALSSLTNAKTALVNAKGTLALAESGATTNDVAASEAQVQVAQATVANAQANLGNAEIIAPISGVLSQQDAKVGQVASPGIPLVSIMGNNGFEVDTGVSDTDVGKLVVGNPVTMTLDAFHGEIFTGSVFYIAPAETNTAGVINYLVKISFDKYDARLKSGLTANIDIQTKKKDNALILPQYAILQDDNGAFVKTLVTSSTTTTTPVTLGIQDESGNVEVISGVTLGEQVVNIGLKQ